MLYDEYSKKIKRIAESKNFILKFRVLIISISALVVSLTIAFLAAKGSVVGGISISDTITYGEKYEYTAKAMFSDVLDYEFKNVNDEQWTNEAPVYVGDYQVRVKVNKAFGEGYSKPKNFTIVPKNLNITINEDEILYGQYPTYSQSGLLSTDKISSLTFEFEDITQEQTLVNPSMDSIEIYNSENIDVTDCYNIIANGKDLKFIKRTISLKPISITEIYNGVGVAPTNSYTISSPDTLGYSDILEIKTQIMDQNGNIVEKAILPGVYTSTIEVVKILSNGLDVTGNYDVEKIHNTIEILKRPISVVTSSASKTYDGKALSSTSFNMSTETESSLLEGHSLKLVDGGFITNVTEYTVQPVKNVLELGIYDSDNNNISDLYDIKYTYGTLSIDKLDLTVISGSSLKEYDGTPITNATFSLAQGFAAADGDELELDIATSSITNVGSVANELTIKVKNGDADVSDSYNITYINGTLTINPRNITVKPVDISDFTYNGRSGEYESYTNNYELVSGSLVDGEDIIISVNITPNSGTSLTDTGDYTVNYKDFNVVGGSKSNYKITADGTSEFTIKPRDITVSLASYSVVYLEDYSYNESSYTAYETTSGENGLIGSDKLSLEVVFDATPLNVGSYGVAIKSHTFISGNSNNYIVRYHDGYHAELTITKRPITIAIKPQDSVVYSNEIYNYPESEFMIISDNYNSSALYELHNTNDWIKLEVNTFDSNYVESSIINAGNYFLQIENYTVSDNVNNNYDVTISENYTPFEIKRRPVTVKAVDHEMTYNNTYYTYPSNDYIIVADNGNNVNTTMLIDGTTFEIGVSYSYNNESNALVYQAGIYDVFVKECYLSDSQSRNYDVSFSSDAAKLTINKETVEITTRLVSTSKIYDGQSYNYNKDNYLITKIGSNTVFQTSFTDQAQISFKEIKYNFEGTIVDEICNAGTYTIKATEIIGNEYFNRNYNYVIVDNSEEFVVEKRSITVATANLESKIYDNTIYTYPENYMKLTYNNGLVSSSVVTNDYIRLSVEFYDQEGNLVNPINAGLYYVKAIGADVDLEYAKNHDVSYSDDVSVFEVLKREVVLSPISLDPVVYDGTKAIYPNEQYTVVGGLGENGDELPTANISIFVQYKTSLGVSVEPINAGTYNMYIDSIIGNYSNYNISYSSEPVLFTILKRDIRIQAATIENVIYGETFSYDYSKYVVVKDNNEDTHDTSLRYGGNLSVSVQYMDEDGNIVNPVNVGKYYIHITDWSCDNEHNYNITKSSSGSEFNIIPRKVTIKAVSDIVIFDNEKYAYNEDNYVIYDSVLGEELSTLYNGEDLKINVLYKKDGIYCDPINAGIYDIEINDLICSNKTLINYDIELSTSLAKLEILKREIILSPIQLEAIIYNSLVYEYDSSKFVYEYSYTQPAPSSDILKNDVNANVSVGVEFRQGTSVKEPINAGTYEVYVVSHTINDNYSVSYSDNPVYFTISPKKVIIKPACDGELMVYTGKIAEYTKNEYVYVNDNDTFLNDDCINVETYTTLDPINAGTYDVYLNTFDMAIGLNENYDVEVLSGQITIAPREVTIRPQEQDSVIYDSTTFIYPKSKFVVILDNGNVCMDDHLYNGEYLELNVEFIDVDGNKIDPVNAGIYYIRAISYYVDELTENNYNITLSDELVQFIITKRSITIKSVSYEEIYSNIEFTYNRKKYDIYDNTTERVNNGLFNRYLLDVVGNIYSSGEMINPINVGKYDIVLSDYIADDYILKNYDITVDDNQSVLTIIPREIVLSAVSLDNKPYKQEAYEYDSSKFNYEYSSNQPLPDNDIVKSDQNANLSVTVEFKRNSIVEAPINAGTYDIYVVSHTSSDNYIVTYSDTPGKFTIDPKVVKIKPACDGETSIYTSLEMEYTKNKYVFVNDEDVLLGDDDIAVITQADNTPIDAGTYTISLVLGEMIRGIKSNYEFVLFTGTITITPRNVLISPQSQISTYDGKYYEYPTEEFIIDIDGATEVIYDLIHDYLSNNLSIVVEFTTLDGVKTSPKDVGFYLIYMKAHNTNSESMKNYVITYSNEPANLEIVKRNISVIATNQPNYTYNGKAYSYPNSSFEIYDNGSNIYTNQLIDGSVITVEVVYKNDNNEIVEPINASTYYIYINNVVFSNPDRANNYHVDYSNEARILVITPREVYVKLEVINDKTYDGNLYQYDSSRFIVYKDNGSAVNTNKLINNEEITLDVYYTLNDSLSIVEPKNAGVYNAYISGIYADELTLNNYDIKYSTEPRVFTIHKMSVLVMPNLIENYYGRFDGTYKELNYDISNSWKYVDETLAGLEHLEYVNNRFVNGDSISSDLITSPNELFNAGYYKVYLNGIEFIQGASDSTIDNYTIYTYTDEVIIDKADITLEAVALEDMIYNDSYYNYDGKYRVVSLNGEVVNQTTLLNNEIINLKVTYYDSYNNSHQNVKNAGSYRAVASSISTTDPMVSNNYNITYSSNSYGFEIIKRQIMVSPISVDKAYSGEEYIYSESSYKTIEPDRNHDGYNDLLDGHTLTVKVYYINTETGDLYGYGYDSNPIDIGLYLILIKEAKIVNANDDVVSNNYEFLDAPQEEYLEISKYKVTIKAISQNKDSYDGMPYVYPQATKSNPYTGDEYYKNIPGVDVLSGTFVKDDSISISVMYVDVLTGEPVVDEFGRYAPAYNAGQYYIRIYNHSIINASNDNYDVTYDNSDDIVLTIGKRTVYYRPRVQANLTYNFDVQAVNPYAAYGGSSDDRELHSLVGNDSFTFDYTITDKNITESLIIKNAQTYYINAIEDSVVFTEGLESNYNIIFSQGSFRVNPLPITVSYLGNQKTYDARPIEVSDEDFSVIVDETKEALGLDYNITSLSIKYNDAVIKLANTINAGKYIINASNIYFTDPNESAENFEITYQAGNYIVNKVKLSVELKDYTYTYNGEAIDYNLVNTRTITGTVIDNQIIKVHVKFSRLNTVNQEVYLSTDSLPVHAGEYLIEYLSYEQCDQFGTLEDDTCLNYIIENVETKKLIINKAIVYLSTNDVDYIYNESEYVYDVNNYSKDAGLDVISDTFKFNVYYVDSLGNIVVNDIGQRINPIDAGMYDIRIDLSSVKQTYNNNSTLYDDYIVYEDENSIGKLNIYKANINIEIINTDYISIYGNNQPISYIVYDDEGLNLPAQYSVNPIFTYINSYGEYLETPVNVGVYKAEIVDFTITYNGKLINKNNYQITAINGEYIRYEIIKRDLNVIVENYEKTYDGYAFDKTVDLYQLSNVLAKDAQYVSVSIEYYLDGQLYLDDIINADEYTIRVANVEISDSVISNNYNIIVHDGGIVISPILIQFKVNLSGKIEYDGKPHYVEDRWEYYSNSLMPLGDTIVTPIFGYTANDNTYEAMTDAYRYNIVLSDIVVTNGLYQNYVGSIVGNPTYEITKLPIKIKTGSLETYYTGEIVTFTEEFTVSSESLSNLVDGHLIQWDEQQPTMVAANKVTKEEGIDNKLGAVIYYVDSSNVKHYVTHNYNISYEYGKLIVKPRPITLISGTKFAEYQGSSSKFVLYCDEFTIGPNIYSSDYYGLIENHTINVTSSTQVLEYTGNAVDNIQSYRIEAEGLGTVTSCYDIEYVYGELFLTKASILIDIDSTSEEDDLLYTGVAYDILDYIIVSRDIEATGDKINKATITYTMVKNQYGEDIEPITYYELIDAGTYEINIYDVKIVKKSNSSVDLTSCYDISFVNQTSTFVIKPLVVRITTNNENRIWDGNDLYNHSYSVHNDPDLDPDTLVGDGKITEGLIAGHRVETVKYAVLNAYDSNGDKRLAASCDNVMEFNIVDTNNNPQNQNYIIDASFGELRFENNINIYDSKYKIFDNAETTLDDINYMLSVNNSSSQYTNLRFKYSVKGIYSDSDFTTPATIYDVGIYYLDVDYDSFEYYVNGIQLTKQELEQFNITYGTFFYNVHARTIFVRPKDLSIEYDGQIHGCTPDEFEDGINYQIMFGSSIKENPTLISNPLIEGDYIVIETSVAPKSSIHSARSYITEKPTIYDKDGNDVTYRYNIYYSPDQFSMYNADKKLFYSKFEITKRLLEYETQSAEKAYDGTALSCDEFISFNNDKLLPGHSISVTSGGMSITNASKKQNKIKFTIVDESGKDVTKYYDKNTNATFGYLVITKQEITVTTGSATKVFDNTPLTCNEFTYTGKLVEGHVIDVTINGTITYKGTKINDCSRPRITSSDGSVVYTSNYDIEVVYGTLTILGTYE